MAADADESKFAFLSQLWPNTLCKFWGLHAAAWGAAAAALVLLSRSALPLPLVGANVVLAALLYRSQEDAGTALAALAGVYFSFHAAMLWLGPAAFMTMRNQPVRLWLRCAQLWHTVLALGGFIFFFTPGTVAPSVQRLGSSSQRPPKPPRLETASCALSNESSVNVS